MIGYNKCWQPPFPLPGFLLHLCFRFRVLPIVRSDSPCFLWVPGSMIVPFTFVVSQSPGSLIRFSCGGSTWNVVCNYGVVSAIFQCVRIGERCEYAYAAGKDANCRASGGLSWGFVVGFCFDFCSIGCLPRERYQMFFLEYV